MIKQWKLERFKSVLAETPLEMAALTIFAGANSSGKSTIVQSLLMTTQTIQNSVANRHIILNGHVVRLGAFDDILTDGSAPRSIGLGFHLCPDFSLENDPGLARRFSRITPQVRANLSLECDFTFSAIGNENEKELLQLQPRLEECNLKLKSQTTVLEGVSIKKSAKTPAKRAEEYKLDPEALQKREVEALEYEINAAPTGISNRRNLKDLKLAGVVLRHFLPGQVAYIYDAIERRMDLAIQILTDEAVLRYSELPPDSETKISKWTDVFLPLVDELANSPNIPAQASASLKKARETLSGQITSQSLKKFHSNLDPIAKYFLTQRIRDQQIELRRTVRGDEPSDFKIGFMNGTDFAEISIGYVNHFFTRLVKYLGPLRDEPKPVYPLAGAIDTRDVGFRGEHTAAVLDVHRHTLVEYVPSSEFTGNAGNPSVKSATLYEAVLDWLSYLGIASDVSTLDEGKLGHKLQVSIFGSNLQDLTHVGVGVSQVLPILVLSLLAEPGSTLVFEQPELHLQPRVQTRLADFFVSLKSTNKQCIVETHSEYLINRLRYRTAVSEGDNLAKDSIIYFVEKENGASKYRPIRINKYGVIEDWPKGFFDEDEELSASILRAGMEKKKREREKESKDD